MNNFGKSLREFIEVAKQNVLWTAGYAVLLVAFSCLTQFIFSLPSQIAAVERNSILYHQHETDGKRILALYDVIGGATIAARRAMTRYQADFGGQVGAPKSSRQLIEGLQTVAEARRDLAIVTGGLHGMQFFEPRINEYRKGFEEDYGTLDQVLAAIETLYYSWISDDKAGAGKARAELRQKAILNDRVSATLLSRVAAFGEETTALQAGWRIAIGEGTGNLRLFRFRTWLASGSLIYILGFVFLAWDAWRKRQQKTARQRRF